jgi:hypothetical protein
MELFVGFQGSHGTHGDPVQEPGSLKWGIKRTDGKGARTVPGPPTLEMWEEHLAGRRPLGVAPLIEDGTCFWGSGDIDDYEVNAVQLVQTVEKMKLPLVPCRSKSGGIHLFLFMAEPVPAVEVQRYLRDVLARLGYAKSEVFPKQAEVIVSRGDHANWMIMPYYGDDYGGRLQMQVGLKAGGGEMTLGEFLSHAEGMRQPRSVLAARPRATPSATGKPADGPFADGPPCLQHLAVGRVKAGHQNNTLLMMGIYYKRVYPATWREELERANHALLSPPGSADGLSSVIRSLSQKDYNYTCKTEPMRSHCNSSVCRMRKYGVGDEGAFPTISGMAKLDVDPPVWFVNVEEARLEVTTEELQDYRRFHAVCMSRLNRCYMALKQADWFVAVAEAMKDVQLLPTPQEVGREGMFGEMLEEFLTNRQRGTSREDLLRGRPWEDEEEGRHYFRLKDLAKFLQREGDRTTTRGQMTSAIKRLGGGDRFFNVKQKGVSCWWVPSSAVHPPERTDPPPVSGVPV